MFTGIIETVGKAVALTPERLAAAVPTVWQLSDGESVAVNGVCLTVASFRRGLAYFALSPETGARTALPLLKAGSFVNLERALSAGARIGGHFVTGHVDGTARLRSVRDCGSSRVIEVEKAPDAVMVEKGSVALDGVSLTVYDVSPASFKAAVIAHTWENTTLKNLNPGCLMNIEYDILGKYASARSPGITREFLKENGFL